MKKTSLSLALLLCSIGAAQAAVIASGSTAGAPGATTAAVPVTITADGSTALIQAQVAYDNTQITLAQANVSGVASGFTCTVNQAGGFVQIIGGNDAGPLAANTTICSIAYPVNVGATLPLTLDVRNQLCSTFDGNPTGQACDAADGQITAGTFAYTFAPPTLNFNGTVGNPTATQNVTVSATAGNTGNLNITGCTFNGANGADFSFNPAPTFPISIAAGNNATLPVRFTAGALGARTGTLDCVTNGTSPGPNFSVTLNGTGATNTLTATPDPLAFPNTVTGVTSAALNVTATAGAGNTGNVTITSCAIGGANAGDFAQTPAVTNVTVAPGASTTVPVRFTPSAAGARAATLTCNLTNGPAATFVINLTGTGVAAAPIITANPVTSTPVGGTGFAGTPLSRSVNFANAPTATSAGVVTCTLTGASPGLTLAGSPLNVAIGANGNITVTGSTNTPSTLTGTLDCTDNAGGSYTYPLSFVFGAPLIAQIPAVDGLGRFALLGLFAGLGMFFAFRKRG